MNKFKIRSQKGFIIVYMVLVMSFLILAVYPTSNAKYIDNPGDVLIYSANINQMYKGKIDDKDSLYGKGFGLRSDDSTSDTLEFFFSFNRNNVVKDETEDHYMIDITVPEGVCSIKSITPKENKTDVNKVTYTTKENVETTVIVNCNIGNTNDVKDDNIIIEENNKKYLSVPIVVREKVGEEEEFTYLDGTYRMSLSDYRNEFPIPSSIISADFKTLSIPDSVENKYADFKDWLTKYAAYYAEEAAKKYAQEMNVDVSTLDISEFNYRDEILAYIQTKYPESSKDSILTDKSLTGLTVKHENGEYVYTIQDNFVGYARTEYTTHNRVIFFSTEDKTLIETIFDNHIKELFKEDPASYQVVKEYIEKNGGIANVVVKDENGKRSEIYGIHYNTKAEQITIDANIVIYATMKDRIDISHTDYITMDDIFYKYALRAVYGNKLSEAALKAVEDAYISDDNFYESVIKNNTDYYTEKVSFTDYYTVTYTEGSTKHYLMIKIYCDLALAQSNFVEITELVDGVDFTGVEIATTNTGDNLSISVISQDVEKVKSTVGYLDTYFGLSTTLPDSFTPDATGNITFTYEIKK